MPVLGQHNDTVSCHIMAAAGWAGLGWAGLGNRLVAGSSDCAGPGVREISCLALTVVELQTNLREDFTITEKGTTSAFTFKTLLTIKTCIWALA